MMLNEKQIMTGTEKFCESRGKTQEVGAKGI